MESYEVVVSNRASRAFQQVYEKVRTASLIASEDVRTAVLARLEKLATNPVADSRKAKFPNMPGDARSVTVLRYRIYYLIQARRVIVLDLIEAD